MLSGILYPVAVDVGLPAIGFPPDFNGTIVLAMVWIYALVVPYLLAIFLPLSRQRMD